jgi:hypothetical protein
VEAHAVVVHGEDEADDDAVPALSSEYDTCLASNVSICLERSRMEQ